MHQLPIVTELVKSAYDMAEEVLDAAHAASLEVVRLREQLDAAVTKEASAIEEDAAVTSLYKAAAASLADAGLLAPTNKEALVSELSRGGTSALVATLVKVANTYADAPKLQSSGGYVAATKSVDVSDKPVDEVIEDAWKTCLR